VLYTHQISQGTLAGGSSSKLSYPDSFIGSSCLETSYIISGCIISDITDVSRMYSNISLTYFSGKQHCLIYMKSSSSYQQKTECLWFVNPIRWWQMLGQGRYVWM